MPTRPLEKEEISKIISNQKSFLNQRDRVMFLTQLYTGLRGAEVCSLRLNQIYKPSFNGIRSLGVINMDISQMKGKKRGRSIHIPLPLQEIFNQWGVEWSKFTGRVPTLKVISLPELTEEELFLENVKLANKKLPLLDSKQIKNIDYNEVVFPSLKVVKSKKGLIPVNRGSYNEILNKVFERNNILGADGELGTHSLRKSYIVDLYNNEKLKSDPLLLIKCTGHQRLETLQHYVGIHDDDVKNAQLSVHQFLKDGKTIEMENEFNWC